MADPFFYTNNYDGKQRRITLDEEASKHAVQVLRMKAGETLNLTDGKGVILQCIIAEAHKNNCVVDVQSKREKPAPQRKTSIAISILKNSNRFEWFLEKATEIGITEIIPLICKRTEKEKFRFDRMQGICISAMLQSQQTWLPRLWQPVSFKNFIETYQAEGKYIAHCMDEEKSLFSKMLTASFSEICICIGPEGDFTNEEIMMALKYHFLPVSLGSTRLRSETAGIVAAALLCHI